MTAAERHRYLGTEDITDEETEEAQYTLKIPCERQEGKELGEQVPQVRPDILLVAQGQLSLAESGL